MFVSLMSVYQIQFNSIYFVFNRSKGVVNPQDIEHVNITVKITVGVRLFVSLLVTTQEQINRFS